MNTRKINKYTKKFRDKLHSSDYWECFRAAMQLQMLYTEKGEITVDELHAMCQRLNYNNVCEKWRIKHLQEYEDFHKNAA